MEGIFIKGSNDVIKFLKHGCKRYHISSIHFKDTPIYWEIDKKITTVKCFSLLQEPATRTEDYLKAVFNDVGIYAEYRDDLNKFFKDDIGEIIFISGNLLN